MTSQQLFLNLTLPLIGVFLAMIGILIGFIITYFRLSEKVSDGFFALSERESSGFSDIGKTLAVIQENTAAIPSLRDNTIELVTLLREGRRGASAEITLKKLGVTAKVSVLDKGTNRARVEIRFDMPIVLPEVARQTGEAFNQRAPVKVDRVEAGSTFIDLFITGADDPKLLAQLVGEYLQSLDERLPAAREWARSFEESLKAKS